jgi:(1->4)-alpha-D-glucan 1-alpha-D-glucosylmutase
MVRRAATYRLQMNAGFTFRQAAEIVPYLKALGISQIYSSPILKARSGSTHGYDLVDPTRLNPELGSDEDFEQLQEAMHRSGLGMILDVVPNHMAASPENVWWVDVLTHGPQSLYADFFDVDWEPVIALGGLSNRILIPVLGRPYGEVLESGQLKLAFADDHFVVTYYDWRFPLTPRSYRMIFETAGETGGSAVHLHELLEEDWESSSPEEIAEKNRRLRHELAALSENAGFQQEIDSVLTRFNGVVGNHRSFDRLDELLESQWYRLSYWRMATHLINYRRFFDVTDLVGLRVERPHVFEARHEAMFRLIREGKVQGLRIDHIDGLFDPHEHLERLHERLDRPEEPLYILVEKILAREETLPEDFRADGTTGYDFLNRLNEVFIDPEGLVRLDEIYESYVGGEADFATIVHEAKKYVLETLFAGEIRGLAADLTRLATRDRDARDYHPIELRQGLVEVTVGLDVYRSYTRGFDLSEVDRQQVSAAIERGRAKAGDAIDAGIFDFLHRVLLLEVPRYAAEMKDEWLEFVMRWQQFSGRVMAKGVEDTAFYAYNRLISLNEVGGEPATELIEHPVDEFHEFNERQWRRWPESMNSSSTHDTKRSEDVRARINVLSELPDQWERKLRRWSRMNAPLRREVGGRHAPDRNEEILIYQSLIGVWPLSHEEESALPDRLALYLEKALREAKRNTSWMQPDADYEQAVREFVTALLSGGSEAFLDDFRPFQRLVSFYGFLNSLSQTILKIGAPGVPDFYQGSELWDFSLVDPDNRRPVDYASRRRLLEEIRTAEPAELLESWRDGRIKLFTIARGLALRNEHPELFRRGEYHELRASGSADLHLCAFARQLGEQLVLFAAPRLLATLVEPDMLPLGAEVWEGQRLELPAAAGRNWQNILTGERAEAKKIGGGELVLDLGDVFRTMPVAILVAGGETP